MIPEKIYEDELTEIWHGNCLEEEHVKHILNDREIGLLAVDAPYSEKTHSGHKNGKLTSDRAAAFAKANVDNPTPESRYSARKSEHGESGRRDINYGHFTESDVDLFCGIWVSRTVGWTVSITDDVLAPIWSKRLDSLDRYVFAPLPLVETGSRVRMSGDGPSNWTCWIVVARPKTREYASWGTLPGAYVQAAERAFNSTKGSTRVVGGKPLHTMIDIIGDYSKKDQLIVDPCVGGGTTCVAAKMMGRKSIGIDKSLDHAKLAAKALSQTKEQYQFKFV